MTGLDMGRAACRVLFRRYLIGPWSLTLLSLFKILFEIRDTPTAPRSRSTTLTDLAGSTWSVQANVIQHFTLRNMEAIADFVVKIHAAGVQV